MADRKEADSQRPECDSFQINHLVPGPCQQAANFSVLAFSQFQLQKRAAAFPLHQLDALELKKSVGKVHALFQLRDHFRRRNTDHLSSIASHNFVTWVSQMFGQPTIVRDQQQPLGVLIQPTNSKQPMIAARHQIDSAGPTTGIPVGAQDAFWFVQQIVLEGRKT